MKFFLKDAISEKYVPIGKDAFIEIYNKSYYLGNDRIVPGVSQSSKFVEGEIDCLLKDGIKTKEDVVHIMAWKLGKVNHKDSNEVFDYASDWDGAKNWKGDPEFTVMRYGKKFEIGKLANFIEENSNRLEMRSKNDPEGVLDELIGLNISGIGPVYLVTLLYFISKGEYPIYDRFAALAVEAILNNIEPYPDNKIEFHGLPEKKDPKAIMKKEREYKDSIKDIFGDAYKNCRDIDRALWVYGHMFNKNKKNK